MPCSCGESNCFCFKKCLCPVELCVCIMCMKITRDAVSSTKPRNTYLQCSSNVSKTVFIADNSKTLTSSDVDANAENLLELHDIDDKSENVYTECNLNISKTLLNVGDSNTFPSLGVDPYTHNLFEITRIGDNESVLYEEKLKPNNNNSSQLDICPIIISSDSDPEIWASSDKRFEDSDEAFDSLLNKPKTHLKNIRTYSRNPEPKKKLDLSKYGPWRTFPPFYTISDESHNSDFQIPLTDDSRVNSNKLGQPQQKKNVENIVTYSEFSRNVRQSHRSSAVPCRKESKLVRKSVVSSYPESAVRNFESLTEVSTAPERRETYKQLKRIPRSELTRAPQAFNRSNPTAHETSVNSRVYDLGPLELVNKSKRGLGRNRFVSSTGRGRGRARTKQTANLTSLLETTGIGSNKPKRKQWRKKKQPLCKTKQCDFSAEKEETKRIAIAQQKPEITMERKFFQKGIKTERRGGLAKSKTIKKEKL